jgi:hypothetical protein
MGRLGVSALAFTCDILLLIDRCLRRARGLRELHEQGGTREEIEGVLRNMPVASPPTHSYPHLLTLY